MNDFVSRLVLSDRRRYRIGRHFLFWFVCWLFMGFIYSYYFIGDKIPREYYFSYIDSLLFLPQHMFLSYLIMYFILPKYMFRGKYWQALTGVVAGILITALFSPFVTLLIIKPLHEMCNIPVKFNRTIFYSFMGGLRGSTTVAGFAVAIKLVKSWYLKKVENERLEKEKLKAELQVLKGQLHPHFMFNTLNSIYSLALKKSDDTPEAILKLSQLMRYILTECNELTVALQREVQILNDYIDLEKNRFGRRLDMAVNIRGDLENKRIAPLLLLPFVENSFKYGANEMLEQAWMSLDLNVQGNALNFKLINGKTTESDLFKNSSRIGLQNVKKRLELLYPDAHALRITEDADTFVVSLQVDIDRIKLPEA